MNPPPDQTTDFEDLLAGFRLTIDESKDGELATLAAGMSASQKNLSAAKLLDRALKFMEEARMARLRRRQDIIEGEAWQVLRRVRDRLFNENEKFADHPAYFQLNDAIGRKAKAQYGDEDEVKERQKQEQTRQAMDQAKKKAGRQCPSLPAPTREILLWICAESTVHLPAVESCFLDFLTREECRRSHCFENHQKNQAERRRIRQDFLNVYGSVGKIPEPDREMIEQYEIAEQDYSFLTNFSVGMEASARSRSKAEATWQRFRQDDQDGRTVEWLAVEFAPFWRKHEGIYLQKLKEKIDKEETIKSKQSESAKKTNQTKRRNTVSKLVDSFCRSFLPEERNPENARLHAKTASEDNKEILATLVAQMRQRDSDSVSRTAEVCRGARWRDDKPPGSKAHDWTTEPATRKSKSKPKAPIELEEEAIKTWLNKLRSRVVPRRASRSSSSPA